MQYAKRMGMTFLGRALAAVGISLVLTLLLLLIFQVDAPQAPREAMETSTGSSPAIPEASIQPISLR